MTVGREASNTPRGICLRGKPRRRDGEGDGAGGAGNEPGACAAALGSAPPGPEAAVTVPPWAVTGAMPPRADAAVFGAGAGSVPRTVETRPHDEVPVGLVRGRAAASAARAGCRNATLGPQGASAAGRRGHRRGEGCHGLAMGPSCGEGEGNELVRTLAGGRRIVKHRCGCAGEHADPALPRRSGDSDGPAAARTPALTVLIPAVGLRGRRRPGSPARLPGQPLHPMADGRVRQGELGRRQVGQGRGCAEGPGRVRACGGVSGPWSSPQTTTARTGSPQSAW